MVVPPYAESPANQGRPAEIGVVPTITGNSIALSAKAEEIGVFIENGASNAGSPATQTVSLNAKENEVGGIDEAQGRAKIFNLYADTVSRLGMVVVISILFIFLNYSVMSFIGDAFKSDIDLIKSKSGFNPSDRLVNAQVIMSLIGATVIQVGVTVVAIVSYLFPKAK
jgi:hypothetical protein